jgi:hypothetical protein
MERVMVPGLVGTTMERGSVPASAGTTTQRVERCNALQRASVRANRAAFTVVPAKARTQRRSPHNAPI